MKTLNNMLHLRSIIWHGTFPLSFDIIGVHVMFLTLVHIMNETSKFLYILMIIEGLCCALRKREIEIEINIIVCFTVHQREGD